MMPKPKSPTKGTEVRFADGRRGGGRRVVYCTGYKVTFPFFDEDLVAAPDNDLPLYRRVFHPVLENLFFVAAAAARGDHAAGRSAGVLGRGACARRVPPAGSGEMRGDMEREQERMFSAT